MVSKSYLAEARKRWSKEAEWIQGNGQFALLAWCRVLTVTLCPTLEEAEKQKQFIDKYACGGLCSGHHEIIAI
jgi:hypothetical protein